MEICRASFIFVFTVCSINPALAATLTLSSGDILIDSGVIPIDGGVISVGGDIDLTQGNTQITLNNSSSGAILTSGNIDLSGGNVELTTPISVNDVSIRITSGDIDVSGGNNQVTPDNEYSIFVDGNLYLDYSVLSKNEDLDDPIDVSLSGETVTIFGFADEPVMPDLATTAIFRNPSMSLSQLGDVLLFSDSPILSGMFEATESLYIGNYASLKPIPLPASLVFFLSGIVALGLRVTTTGKSRMDSTRK